MQLNSEPVVMLQKKLYEYMLSLFVFVFLKGDAQQKKHDSDDPSGKCNNELTWLTTEVGSEESPLDKNYEQHGN